MTAAPTQHFTVVNDTRIAWVEWGEPGSPVALLSHATGFHSRCWDEVAARLDGFHVIATDHRCHGRSDKGPIEDWQQLGADLTRLIVALDLSDVVGVGHSMGAHCMVQAAASEPQRFRELLLFDPVILPPGLYGTGVAPFGGENPVARRRKDWDSPRQMCAALRAREPFSRWHESVLHDYCEHGLVSLDDGYELACRPEDEAKVYASSLDMDIYTRIPLIDQPVTIVRAEWRGLEEAVQDFSLSPTWPELAGRFSRGQDVYLPARSHFLPMEDPELAAAFIRGENPDLLSVFPNDSNSLNSRDLGNSDRPEPGAKPGRAGAFYKRQECPDKGWDKMNGRLRHAAVGLLWVSGALSLPAVAADFQWGEIEGSFNSQISVGASWRMSDRDPLLVTPGNDSRPDPNGLFGVYGEASTGTADDGNANYDDGDMYSLILKGVHDLELRKGDFGLFLRGKYWYDQELAHGSVPHGNSSNFYASGASLDDSQFDDFAKAKGMELLDAFLYGTFYFGDSPLDLRIGRQVASWGESTFIQNGINSINPIDVSAFRRPGAEIKEGLLPVNMVTVSMGLTDALSFDAFYQLDWEKTVIDGCGTYFSTADVAATGCSVVTLTGLLSDAANMAGGLYITRLPDIEPDDSGQYGLSFRYFAEGLGGSEFGVYYMNYHSRIPYLGGYSSANVLVPQAVVDAALPPEVAAALGYPLPPFIPRQPAPGVPLPPGVDLGAALGGGNPQYFAEFPEDIELFGVSFATNVFGFAVSGEVSHRPDFPVQINTTEILQGAVGLAPWSTVLPRIIEVGPGNPASGYDTFAVTQAQVTFIRFFEQVLGASRLSFAAEVGGNWVEDLPEQSVQRYGRSPTFGMGYFEPIPLSALGVPVPGEFVTCEAGNALAGISPPNYNSRNCTTDGYVTDSSWGYRIRAGLTYNDAFSGVNLTPTLAWSHDVDGYSPNSNFTEGSKALSLGLNAEYLNRYTGSISYTSFSGGDYSTVKDRDFLSVSFSVSF